MENENNNKIYALAGVMGGISFAGAYLFGSGLTIATGIPIMSATVNGFWVGLIISTTLLMLKKYRFIATSMMLLYGLAATFTVLLGPPGWYKIPIALIMGFCWDVSYKLLPNLIGQIIGSALFITSGILLIVFALQLQESPAADKLIKALPFLLSISNLTAIAGSVFGYTVIGKRIIKLPIVKRIIG
jgi:hypothetical protein